MKRYNEYIITWWEGLEYHTKKFKLEKPAKRFAAQLADNENADERNFYAYDSNGNMTDEFSF